MARKLVRISTRRRALPHSAGGRSPLQKIIPRHDICLELQDHTHVTKSAVAFFGSNTSADPTGQAARLADQFITQNAPLFQLLEVEIRRDYDGRDVLLHIVSGSAIGAVPLISPLTGRPDFGLVIQPRFPWAGIGPMLAEMGWLISPRPLRLPLLKRSERQVPPWVVSVMVLARLKALLDGLQRRFELTTEALSAPKGNIDWTQYATRQLPRGNFLSVPCTFPDLRDDRDLKGAIRFAIEKQLRSLETQREQGAFIHRLIALAESLLRKVDAVASRRPARSDFDRWLRVPMRTDTFAEGLRAIDWTVEERGLAGLSDLEGLPWTMSMNHFFEAWVETVMRSVARQMCGTLKVGRRRETVSPLSWDPPYLGSQRSFIPDMILELEGTSFIVDAKYKRHWEELQSAWHEQESVLHERHRADLLQVLAYANLASVSNDVICCLVYPCSQGTWESLARRGRLFHQAELPNRGRRVRIWLTAIPMGASANSVAAPLTEQIRTVTRIPLSP
jgi:5-methylcytosine-specific restriction endonuclease McrBC regulatory subunit McrC